MSASEVSNRFKSTVVGALIFNLATKVATFSLTTVLTRSVSASSRGVGFTLDVYTNTAMFLIREAVRMTNARNVVKPNDVKSITRVTNTAALCALLFIIPLLLLVCIGSALPLGLDAITNKFLALGDATTDGPAAPFWWVPLYLVGLCLELGSEPAQALSQSFLLFKMRIAAESLGLGARLGAAIVVFRVLGEGNVAPIVAFALGQFMYGATIFTYMQLQLRNSATAASAEWSQSISKLRESKLPVAFGGVTVDGMKLAASQQFHIWREFFSETVLRLALTEGEKVLLTVFGTLASQGIYDVVTNLSSVFARLVFRVWEDACFTAWTKMASTLQGKREAAALLQRMLRMALYLGIMFAVFGPPLSKLALTILYSSRWAGDEAVAVMQASCLVTPLLGINGLTEAFVRATGEEKHLRYVKVLMTATSVIYVGLSYFALSNFGVAGLLYANCTNMVLRIVGSAYLIGDALQYNAGQVVDTIFSVDKWIAIASLMVGLLCRSGIPDLAIIACAPLLAAVIVRVDPTLWDQLRRLFNKVRGRRND